MFGNKDSIFAVVLVSSQPPSVVFAGTRSPAVLGSVELIILVLVWFEAVGGNSNGFFSIHMGAAASAATAIVGTATRFAFDGCLGVATLVAVVSTHLSKRAVPPRRGMFGFNDVFVNGSVAVIPFVLDDGHIAPIRRRRVWCKLIKFHGRRFFLVVGRVLRGGVGESPVGNLGSLFIFLIFG